MFLDPSFVQSFTTELGGSPDEIRVAPLVIQMDSRLHGLKLDKLRIFGHYNIGLRIRNTESEQMRVAVVGHI